MFFSFVCSTICCSCICSDVGFTTMFVFMYTDIYTHTICIYTWPCVHTKHMHIHMTMCTHITHTYTPDHVYTQNTCTYTWPCVQSYTSVRHIAFHIFYYHFVKVTKDNISVIHVFHFRHRHHLFVDIWDIGLCLIWSLCILRQGFSKPFIILKYIII